MYDRNNDNTIWVSDPTRKLATVKLIINYKEIDVQLPQGNYAGSSVNIKI